MNTPLHAAKGCCLLWVALLVAAVPVLAGPGVVHATRAAKIQALQDQERMDARLRVMARPAKAEAGPSLWTRVTGYRDRLLRQAATPPQPEPEASGAPIEPCGGGPAARRGLVGYLKPSLLLLLLAANPLKLSDLAPAGGQLAPFCPADQPFVPGWLEAAQGPGLEGVIPDLEAAFPNAVQPCPAASEEPVGKPWPAVPIDIMGLGELAGLDPGVAPRRLKFGVRVLAGPGFVNGWLSVDDRRSRLTFTGTAREVEVAARDGSGAPRVIHFSGHSANHDGATFHCTIEAPADPAGKARLSVSVRGGPVTVERALTDLASGYLTIHEDQGDRDLVQLGPPEAGGHP